MFKRIIIFILLILPCATAFGQVKEIIDTNIMRIRFVPYGRFGSMNWKKDEKTNARYRKENLAYHTILALDTLAIPYLIDRISDSTEANLRVPCSPHNLKVGDVAFALLNDIIIIPWHTVTGEDWEYYTCDSLPDGGWVYLHDDRVKFQNQLRLFFASKEGKIWVSIFKDTKMKKTAKAELIKKFKNLMITPSEVASTQGD